MSKLDIGVGEEFPLDEGAPEKGRHAWKHHYRAERRAHRRHGHHHHHGHYHHHGWRGLLHLPLFLAVAAIAALIGAGKIPPLASEVIAAVAAVLVLLAILAHFWHHRRWHADHRTP
jgi:hypothetical protein